MNIFMFLVGIVLMFCGIAVAVNRVRTNEEHPNGIMEWILAGIGLVLIVLAYGGNF